MVRTLEPQRVWTHFVDLAAVPRESLHEQRAVDHVRSLAQSWGLSWSTDARGNLVVRKPASPGREGRPTVVLQAHLDMVCEQDRGGTHDFAHDPIVPVVEDGWVRAQGTTLGADNGLGVAVILAILEDRSLVHGPLEALFTLDEEREMTGAAELDPALVTGRLVLNLDGEGPGRLVVGSAGGGVAYGQVPLTLSPPDAPTGWLVVLSGLEGGHSGVEIHRGVGNALTLLARFVSTFLGSQAPGLWQLASLEGGDKDNAIPRESAALLAGPVAGSALIDACRAFGLVAAAELGPEGRGLTLSASPAGLPDRVLTPASQEAFLDLLAALPDGVVGRSKVVPGLVETSSNLGRVRVDQGQASLVVAPRSASLGLLNELLRSVAGAIRLAGGTVDARVTYPPWTPVAEGRLRDLAVEVWNRSHPPAVLEVIHAGLECGHLAEKLPGAQIVSYGPEIVDMHTPRERVEIASVAPFYRYTLDLLEAL